MSFTVINPYRFGTPAGTVFFQDAFTDSDGVLLENHTPTAVGASWAKHGACAAVVKELIASNRVYSTLVAAYDTFTAADNTTLQTHTSDSGHTWTENVAYSGLGDAVITGNRVRVDGTVAADYLSWSPPSADYYAEADVYVVSDVGETGIAIRMDATVDTMYLGRYRKAGGAWELYKVVAGSYTSLGTSSATLSVGSTYHMRLQAVGTAIKLFVDGTAVINVTDSDISAAGGAGVRVTGSGATTGYHLDNFQVVSVTNASTQYVASGTPASADYDVQADLYVVTMPLTAIFYGAGVIGRANNSGARSWYQLTYSGQIGKWELDKIVSGTVTSLGTYTQVLSASNSYTMKLQMRGTAIKAFIGGVERISVTDSDISATGQAGIGFGEDETAATGYHLDNFVATNA